MSPVPEITPNDTVENRALYFKALDALKRKGMHDSNTEAALSVWFGMQSIYHLDVTFQDHFEFAKVIFNIDQEVCLAAVAGAPRGTGQFSPRDFYYGALAMRDVHMSQALGKTLRKAATNTPSTTSPETQEVTTMSHMLTLKPSAVIERLTAVVAKVEQPYNDALARLTVLRSTDPVNAVIDYHKAFIDGLNNGNLVLDAQGKVRVADDADKDTEVPKQPRFYTTVQIDNDVEAITAERDQATQALRSFIAAAEDSDGTIDVDAEKYSRLLNTHVVATGLILRAYNYSDQV